MAESSSVIAVGVALAALFFSRRANASAQYTDAITTADDQALSANYNDMVNAGDAFLIGQSDYWTFPTATPAPIVQPTIDDSFSFETSDLYGFDFFDNTDYFNDSYVIGNQSLGTDMLTPQYQKPIGISLQGLDILKQREGFSATPYWDKKGYSIGYGHLIKPGEKLEFVTVERATELLFDDVGNAESAINMHVDANLTQNQYDALVSFVYNIGNSAFINSTMLRKINAGDSSAVDEFDRWKYSRDANNNLEVNLGLVDRRAQEKSQFMSA